MKIPQRKHIQRCVSANSYHPSCPRTPSSSAMHYRPAARACRSHQTISRAPVLFFDVLNLDDALESMITTRKRNRRGISLENPCVGAFLSRRQPAAPNVFRCPSRAGPPPIPHEPGADRPPRPTSSLSSRFHACSSMRAALRACSIGCPTASDLCAGGGSLATSDSDYMHLSD